MNGYELRDHRGEQILRAIGGYFANFSSSVNRVSEETHSRQAVYLSYTSKHLDSSLPITGLWDVNVLQVLARRLADRIHVIAMRAFEERLWSSCSLRKKNTFSVMRDYCFYFYFNWSFKASSRTPR
jgi:hypothetical protein